MPRICMTLDELLDTLQHEFLRNVLSREARIKCMSDPHKMAELRDLLQEAAHHWQVEAAERKGMTVQEMIAANRKRALN